MANRVGGGDDMTVGKVWPPEWRTYNDPVSGLKITQLTNFKGHSHHPYFTEPGWYADGRKFIFVSERYNRPNLFSVDLQTGEITQLTDLDPAAGQLTKPAVSPARDEACFLQGAKMYVLDLDTYEMRHIYTRPDGYLRGSDTITADGKYALTYHVAAETPGLREKLGEDYYRFRDFMEGHKGSDVGDLRKMVWESRPPAMIVNVALDGSGSQTIYEENYFLAHVNPSPTNPSLATFCHEGPWHLVENRIWGLNIDTGVSWMIRPNAPEEAVGHEYWMADGEHIGYHGRTPNGPIYGSIRYDNTDQVEAPFAYGSTHFHSRSLELIVGDGSRRDPYLLLWRFRDGGFQGPKVLAFHRASLQLGTLHVHPCFHPRRNQIIYTADPQGYGQLFMIDVPDDFDSLPDRESV